MARAASKQGLDPVADSVIEIIEGDKKDLVDLCLRLSQIRSPTAKERPAAEAVVEWLKNSGIEARVQPITEESANALGFLRGTGGGKSLICDAHIDNSEQDQSIAQGGDLRRMQDGFVEGGLIYGSSIINCKAQVAAFMTAARALKKAGVRLKGDVIIAAVATETGQPSVDEFQGVNRPGEGFGSRWLIDRGIIADYALVGETSNFGIIQMECGEAHYKLRVTGKQVYTPRMERSKRWQDSPNVYVKAAHLALALEEWAIEYERKNKTAFKDSLVIPKSQITGMRGDRAAGTGGRNCDIYVDVRLLPGQNPRAVQDDLHRLAKSVGLDCEITLYQWSRGYAAKNAEPLVEALKQNHRLVIGGEPPPPSPPELSMWRDINAFNEVGIPSVCYGPARQRETVTDAGNRAMKISDLVAAAKVYALTMVSICGLDGSRSAG